MFPIIQYSRLLNDPLLLTIALLILAFSLLVAACLVGVHLRDKALQRHFDDVFADLPDTERKLVVALAILVIHASKKANLELDE